MRFKDFIKEWEGNTFLQAADLRNTGDLNNGEVRSKYITQDINTPIKEKHKKPEKLFGIKINKAKYST